MIELLITSVLTIVGISNIITNQDIGRRLINYVLRFKPENYLMMGGIRRFLFDITHCQSCLSFYVALIYMVGVSGLIDIPLLMWIQIPIISVLFSWIIDKK